MTTGEIYKCIKKNKSGFEVGNQYIISGESQGYSSDYDQLEPIDIILLYPNNSVNWSKIKHWPKHNFEEYFDNIMNTKITKNIIYFTDTNVNFIQTNGEKINNIEVDQQNKRASVVFKNPKDAANFLKIRPNLFNK
jgi:hypothetical protein